MEKAFKNLLGIVAALLVLVPLGVAFLPLFYMLGLALPALVPLAFVVTTIGDTASRQGSDAKKAYYFKLLLALVYVPLVILAFVAPLRAILIAVFSFFPGGMAKFNEPHAFIYSLFEPWFGPLTMYWVDFWWGALSVVVIFLFAFFDSVRRNKLVRQIEILPTAKIRSVAMGLVELKGKAVPVPGTSRSDPIMRSWIESTSDGMSALSTASPFYLDDGTGLILVDPTGCTINDEPSMFSIALHQAILKHFRRDKALPESRLTAGDTVYVVGNVQSNPDHPKEGGHHGDAIMLKPRKSSLLSLNFYDIFFLSNISEQALLDGLRSSVKRGWGTVVAGMSFGVWLAAFSLTNIMQIQAMDVDAAPSYLRLISTPTTLEREIEVYGIGTQSTIEFVEMLDAGERDQTKPIMMAFRDLGLTDLAVPVLLVQAGNIDHPEFAVANHWLQRLELAPPGQWGLQYWSSARKLKLHESGVLRVLIRFKDNRLVLSYRAQIGDWKIPEHESVVHRKFFIELDNKATGERHSASFDAHIGVNEVDDVIAFEHLDEGEYEVDAYVETLLRSGRSHRGWVRRDKPEIALRH